MEALNGHQPCYFLCCPVITSCILFVFLYHELFMSLSRDNNCCFPEIMRLSFRDLQITYFVFPENTIWSPSLLQAIEERFLYYGVPE